jgi:phosphate acetyltransferase
MSQTEAFLQYIFEKSKKLSKHIVLPEGEDIRTLEAAREVSVRGLAGLTILGDAEKITAKLNELGADMTNICVVNPSCCQRAQTYAREFYELRKSKGMELDQAIELLKNPMYYGMMMVKSGDADGFVAGASHSSADTIRPALQIIKCAPGVKTVSSMFFMCRGEETYLFSDCGLNVSPTPAQIADITLATANTAKSFDIKPMIAILSYSTKGSGLGPDVEAAAESASLAKEKMVSEFKGDYAIDGELQFDAAFVPQIAASKAPDSELKGQANTFIFPDLSAGNIGYKMAERLASMSAYGPILQGIAKPVNDLSRGCSSSDIVATVAITAIQAVD